MNDFVVTIRYFDCWVYLCTIIIFDVYGCDTSENMPQNIMTAAKNNKMKPQLRTKRIINYIDQLYKGVFLYLVLLIKKGWVQIKRFLSKSRILHNKNLERALLQYLSQHVRLYFLNKVPANKVSFFDLLLSTSLSRENTLPLWFKCSCTSILEVKLSSYILHGFPPVGVDKQRSDLYECMLL